MKRILWLSSLTMIFLNMIIAILFMDYPVLNNIFVNLSVLAVGYLVYVVFFEKKISAIIRNISIVFGLTGLSNVVFNIISLHIFAVNFALASILFLTLGIIFSKVIIQSFLRE
ncbi:MAG: hypothetical protein JJE25_05795 [Bacteroidia bacterium]|nr:hypothetical protein [Bacteroidia bacterium]